MTTMMTNGVSRTAPSADDPATATYREVVGQLHKIAQHFHQRVGNLLGDWDDLMGICNMAFWTAYTTYKPGAGANFNTWVYIQATGKLREMLRAAAIRHARHPTVGLTDEVAADLSERSHGFDPERLLREIGSDAATVLRLALQPNLDMKLTMSCRGTGKPTAGRTRKALLEFLRDLGWCAERVARAFEEVREALG